MSKVFIIDFTQLGTPITIIIQQVEDMKMFFIKKKRALLLHYYRAISAKDSSFGPS